MWMMEIGAWRESGGPDWAGSRSETPSPASQSCIVFVQGGKDGQCAWQRYNKRCLAQSDSRPVSRPNPARLVVMAGERPRGTVTTRNPQGQAPVPALFRAAGCVRKILEIGE